MLPLSSRLDLLGICKCASQNIRLSTKFQCLKMVLAPNGRCEKWNTPIMTVTVIISRAPIFKWDVSPFVGLFDTGWTVLFDAPQHRKARPSNWQLMGLHFSDGSSVVRVWTHHWNISLTRRGESDWNLYFERRRCSMVSRWPKNANSHVSSEHWLAMQSSTSELGWFFFFFLNAHSLGFFPASRSQGAHALHACQVQILQ